MAEQEKRGPGRPSLGKERMYFTLSGDIVEALKRMPAGDRSGFAEQAIREKLERESIEKGKAHERD